MESSKCARVFVLSLCSVIFFGRRLTCCVLSLLFFVLFFSGLVVDDDGNLRIQVGGTTNAGYNQAGKNLGGIDESPLSGASLIAYISKSGFDGHIKYDVDNPGRANQVGGKDVQVYMAGWRNSYGINTHSNGFIYATDNGASQAFGGRSLSCTKDGPLPSTADLADRLGKVVKGKYFGHPNRNRGRRRSMECTFMNSKKASGDYLPHVLELESSTDGIVEYHMDTFDGQLKGNLMLSKYTTDKNPGALQRVRLDEQGEAVSDEEVLLRVSGLSIEMSPWGDLIMPQLWKKVVLVIRPTVSRATGQKFVGVMPARGSYRGGNQVIVTGINIGSSPGALFGDKPCTSVTAATSTSFKCIVPAGTPGGRVQVTLKSSAGDTPSSGGHDYKYMKV